MLSRANKFLSGAVQISDPRAPLKTRETDSIKTDEISFLLFDLT